LLSLIGKIYNAETADRLREFGCEVAQGYFCSPPISAAAMMNMLASGHSERPARVEREGLRTTGLKAQALAKSS
jgi:diguanylate cyclase